MSSVDKENLQTVVRELGTMFHDTGGPLQRLLDNGSTFIDEASAHTDETRRAARRRADGAAAPSEGQGENIRSFSRDLALITEVAQGQRRRPAHDARRTRPATARELDTLLTDLEPTLPVLLGNAISVDQVVACRTSPASSSCW